MRGLRAIFFAILAISISSGQTFAEKRVALVIGNSAYENVVRLANPANDAVAMTTILKEAGFDVVDSRRNLKIADMRRAFRDFSEKSRDADVAVVYYAGHGIEVDGSNYLIPIDAALERDLDVYDEAFSLDRVLITIEPAKQLRLVMLDACRDNPFAKTMKRTVGSRAIGRGLAKVEPTSPNTLIAFASKAGSTASDGDSKNSPFTSALLKHIATPGLDLRKAFGYVRDDVLKNTSNRQEPYVYGSLGGDDVPLVPANRIAAQPVGNEQDVTMRRDYEFADRVGTRPAWEAFIERYPSGFFTALAKAQRDKLAAEETRVAATEKARLAQEEKTRLAAEGAKQAEQAKAAAQARTTEEARLAAEKAERVELAKVAAAEQAQATPGKAATPTATPNDASQEAGSSQQVASLPPEPVQNKLQLSARELARSIQIELKRVGCFGGLIDGEWNSSAQNALDTFNKRAATKLDVKLASLDALDAVKSKHGRICPLSCERGFRAEGETCKKIVCQGGYRLNEDYVCEKRRDRIVRESSTPKRAAFPRSTQGGKRKCFVYGGQSFCE